jgi:hypothetical protein
VVSEHISRRSVSMFGHKELLKAGERHHALLHQFDAFDHLSFTDHHAINSELTKFGNLIKYSIAFLLSHDHADKTFIDGQFPLSNFIFHNF